MKTLLTIMGVNGKIDPKDIGITDAVTSSNQLVSGILTPVYIWAGILCVAIIIVAAYIFTTSGSNAAQVKRAKDAIAGAIAGLVIVMLAFVITTFVVGRF